MRACLLITEQPMSLARHGIAAVTAICLTTAAQATPISYSEGTDLHPNQIGDLTLFTLLGALEVGNNLVSGSVQCASVPGSSVRCDGDEADVFRVTLGAGMKIVSASISVSDFVASSGTSAYSGILGGPMVNQSLGGVDQFSAGLAIFPGAAAATPGTMAFFTSVFPTQGQLSYDGAYRYTWSIQVASLNVAEPGTALLAAAAVLALWGPANARRRGRGSAFAGP
jgi:hypothetical protein